MNLTESLDLKRCPHCSIANPNVTRVHQFNTQNANKTVSRIWLVYVCKTCGGAIIGARNHQFSRALEIYPTNKSVDESIPNKAKQFLIQAIDTIHAPSGSIMLSASSIDAMLKNKGYKDGSLYSRIKKAADDNIITEGMSEWAHQIRLEANDQRHADEDASLPTEKDAQRIVDFAMALAEFLYVLPTKVIEGIEETKDQ
ncbi:DUF4145 domain-containing protein [Salegentibacter sp. F188]|uniref:DUF4145 domain-containing protein n=1 Tax=Autumnicola patrickiae TaxID=3075591 RepID=A0ABU3E3S2_9FLAO|nr:DUF4145 domain-containing protein [Salegentibacter sp. F188]MDT0690636.1 DUF4145 domain-containing protein [Salegentibacter sp. F188]